MLFAERWSAAGGLALCAAAVLGTVAVVTTRLEGHRWHHGHHGNHHGHAHISFDQPGCREWIPPPATHVDVVPIAALEAAPFDLAQPRTYDGVLADAAPLFEHCFARDHKATELLVTIGPDGRVKASTTRPEPETARSRCVENVVKGLVFPAADTTVMMRVPIKPTP